jgi:hypothetical protein
MEFGATRETGLNVNQCGKKSARAPEFKEVFRIIQSIAQPYRNNRDSNKQLLICKLDLTYCRQESH